MVGRPRRQEIYKRLDEAFDELRTRMGGLPSPVEAEGIWTTIWFEEAHHSTAIEGNTLVLKQVERLLAEGLAVGDKELKEYMEVRGLRGRCAVGVQPGARAGRMDDRRTAHHHRGPRSARDGVGAGVGVSLRTRTPPTGNGPAASANMTSRRSRAG